MATHPSLSLHGRVARALAVAAGAASLLVLLSGLSSADDEPPAPPPPPKPASVFAALEAAGKTNPVGEYAGLVGAGITPEALRTLSTANERPKSSGKARRKKKYLASDDFGGY